MNKEMKMTVKKSEMILYCDNCGDKDRDFYEINDEGGKCILHLCKDCLMALLDGRDYSMPQHRERVLIVSIRKDIDNGIFEFPAPVELTKCMNDYLEETVDEKYFVDTEKARALIPKLREKLISNTIRGGVIVNRT